MARLLAIILLILALVATAAAHDLSGRPPTKPVAHHSASAVDPAMLRQGGDTILDAIVIDPPCSDAGTTVGYTDDYDEECPYTQSTSPDVVYSFTSDLARVLDIDMYGSTYDTKIYLYDQYLTLIACNDDYYPDYVSRLVQVAIMGGVEYYLVIDGYGGDAGDYVLNIVEHEPCVVDCPVGAVLEGEPPLVDGYVDNYNGGCNTEGADPPFQDVSWGTTFCGRSGWYLGPDGSQIRDTDWFRTTIPYEGFIEITVDAEAATYIFELGPQDCEVVAVLQQMTVGPCLEGTMTITGSPGSPVWWWAGPTTFDGQGEYDYVAWIAPYG